MLNEEFILKRIEPYLNSKRELSEFEFFELFSDLDLHEQYEVINIMIAHDIEYVDEKQEETEKLDALAQRGDQNAIAAILEKNKRFVYSLALKLSGQFIKTNLSVDDLYQEGNIGLMEAIEKFDVTRDNRFITYSWHWIRQRISRAAIDTGYLIRLPVHKFEEITKLYTCRKKSPEADISELAKAMSVNGTVYSEKDISELIMISESYLNITSLNTLVGDSEDSELLDFIPDENAVSIEDEIAEKQLREDVESVLRSLTSREACILRLRFGFEDGQERTLEEVGCVFHVTRERIRQIEAKALRKLKHPSRSKKLRPYYEE